MQDKLLTAIAGKAAPDISIIDQFWGAGLADANAVLAAEDFFSKDASFDKTDIYDYAWKTATYKNKAWSMPFSTSNEVLYYNKAMFKAAGLDPKSRPRPGPSWPAWPRRSPLTPTRTARSISGASRSSSRPTRAASTTG